MSVTALRNFFDSVKYDCLLQQCHMDVDSARNMGCVFVSFWDVVAGKLFEEFPEFIVNLR